MDVSKVAAAIGQVVCKALPGMHAFTGCDLVSAFGKLNAMKLLMKSTKYEEAFTQLVKEWLMSNDLFSVLQYFTCHLYAAGCDTTKVNELRYHLFKAKKGKVDSSQLPPCENCLNLHALRANYQSAIWGHSLQTTPRIPNPSDSHGCHEEDNGLSICWMTGPPAPDVVLEFLSCICKRACKLPDCECLVNRLRCTAMCKLRTCDNMKDDDSDEEQTDTDSISDYELS